MYPRPTRGTCTAPTGENSQGGDEDGASHDDIYIINYFFLAITCIVVRGKINPKRLIVYRGN